MYMYIELSWIVMKSIVRWNIRYILIPRACRKVHMMNTFPSLYGCYIRRALGMNRKTANRPGRPIYPSSS